MTQSIEVVGIEDLQKLLTQLVPRHSYNLLRATVNAAAAEVRKLARKEAPKRLGVLKKAIKNRRLRSPRERPAAEVYVQRQAFYWPFVNYGTKKQPADNFRERAVMAFQQDKERFLVEAFKNKLAKLVEREQKKHRAKVGKG